MSVYVAEDGGEVVAFASGLMLAERKFGLDAVPSAIYLRGTASAPATARGSSPRSAMPSAPWRDRNVDMGHRGRSTRRAFYESLGAELRVEQPFQWDGMDLVEAGYGWRDLDALTHMRLRRRKPSGTMKFPS